MKTQIAVVGIGAIFPEAMDLSEYWSNILASKDSIIRVPENFWDLNEFYDPDPQAKDKTYGTKAGLIDFVPFDSLEFGIPPRVMESISVDQLFALVVAKQALLDANMLGKDAKPFNRNKTGVILASNIGKNAFSLSQRLMEHKYRKIMENSHVPEHLIDRVIERMKDSEFEWNEDCNPGALPNVTSGRIANRFDLYGTNCTVDAACASSLAALKYGINELESGDCDAMLVGGVMIDCTPYSFIAFAKTPAIAPSNESKPFDEKSDGIILGDGIGMVVIKRLEDAIRDKDRIYGVIESVGSSSDGKAKSIFAPRKEGQLFALERAYKDTGIDPNTLGMIEAHGTGTAAGDECEIDALKEYFSEFNVKEHSILIGSVKSQIGHSRLTSGAASLIKALMALYHKTLPPTINIKKPTAKLLNSPFFLSNRPKPWLVNKNNPLRRAGISAFGFGGTNFHVIAREYENNNEEFLRINQSPVGLYLHNKTKEGLIEDCKESIDKFEMGDTDHFNELYNNVIPHDHVRLGFVAKNVLEAKDKLYDALEELESNDKQFWNKQDIFYRERALGDNLKVVSLFPGQGSQYANMLSDVTASYKEVQDMFEIVDNTMIDMEKEPVSSYVYPKTLLNKDLDKYENELTSTNNTQPALAAVSGGLYRVLKNRGYKEDYLIGHSFGEITALWAADVINDMTYANLAVKRGDIMSKESCENTAMVAVFCDRDTTCDLIKGFNKVYLANENSDKQTIVSGDESEIKKLEAELLSKKISYKRLKVSAAFHSPFMEKPQEEFSKVLSESKFQNLNKKILANSIGDFYPESGEEVKNIISKQMTNSVLFKSSIKKAYDDGARIFVEIGPGKVLSSLVDQILEDLDHETISINPNKMNDSIYQLEGAIVQMRTLGIDVQKDHYFRPLRLRQDTPRNKSTYMLPPLHYLGEETLAKIDAAVHDVDPLPDEQDVKETSFESKEVKTNIEPIKQQVDIDLVSDLKKETKDIKINDVVEEPIDDEVLNNSVEGDFVMGKEENKNFVRSPLQDAYGLQSLNSEVFKQFMQAQSYQLNMFNEMLEIANSNQETKLDGFLNFIESFQNNSIGAYNTYFNEQRNMLSSVSGGAIEGSSFEFMNVISEPRTSVEPPPMLKPIAPKVAPQPAQQTPEPKITKEQVVAIEEAPIREAKQVEEVKPVIEAKPVEVKPVDIKPADEVKEEVSANAEASPKKPVMNAEQMEKRIIEVISDRTGYPVDMIDGEMSIESDLGIDSIKRVEIFSVLNDELDQGFTQEDIEVMTTLSSIRDFAEFLADKMSGNRPTNGPIITQENYSMLTQDSDEGEQDSPTISPIDNGGIDISEALDNSIAKEDNEEEIDLNPEEDLKIDQLESDSEREIKRYEVFKRSVESPKMSDSTTIAKDGLVLISCDKEGLSFEVGKNFKDKGYKVEYLNILGTEDERCKYKLEGTNDAKVKALFESISSEDKSLIGFIHVASPQDGKEISDIFNQREMDILRANFMLAKHFMQFHKKPAEGKDFFVAVTRMDGNMGLNGENTASALQGGFYGLVKSLAREWKNTHCKVVDIAVDCENKKAASYIMEEIFSESDGIVEVGRNENGERFTIDMREKYDEDPANTVPTKDDVFLVTGGGRGVSAVCALKLAEEYKCKFILLGRSEIDKDISWANGETDTAKLRQLIIGKLKEANKPFKPIEVDKMITAIQNQSEIQINLKAITEAGGKVVYYSCDVTNEDDLNEVIKKGVSEMGEITGFAHGVGVIADKKIERKAEKDFNNVFGTKIVGLKRCLNMLNLEKLKYIVMFSSVAAYFGNEGQADYSMANEVLNKFVYAFRKKYPEAMSLSINWGPWKGGMVSEALQYVITAIGEKMIPMDVGSEYFKEQFRFKFKPEACQICIAGTEKYIPHDIDFSEIM